MSAFHLILCEHIHESVWNIYLLNFKIRAITKMNFLFECKKNEFFLKFKTFFSKNWRKNSFVYVWMHKGKLKKLSRKKEFLNFNFLQTDENHSPFQHLSFKSCEKLTDAFQLRTSSVKRHFMKCKRIEEGLVSMPKERKGLAWWSVCRDCYLCRAVDKWDFKLIFVRFLLSDQFIG